MVGGIGCLLTLEDVLRFIGLMRRGLGVTWYGSVEFPRGFCGVRNGVVYICSDIKPQVMLSVEYVSTCFTM